MNEVSDSYEAVQEALHRWGRVRLTEGGWLARCPAHDDRQGTLLVLAAGDGRVELDCLGGGCDTDDIAAALRLGAQYVVVPPPKFDDGPGWIWPGWVPSVGMTLIDGEDGVNAMAVALDVAARVSAGSAMPDGQPLCRPRNIGVLTAGHTTLVTQRVLAASGAVPGRTEVLEVLGRTGRRGLRLPSDRGELQERLASRGIELLVVDVMLVTPYRTPVERALLALAELSRATGIAVLAVREASKRAGWLASRRAEQAASSCSTEAVHLAVRADDAMALVPVASQWWKVMGGLQFRQANRSRPVVWQSRFARGRQGAMEAADRCRIRPASFTAESFLQSLLADGPVATRDVLAEAEAVGLAARTVQRARNRLGVVATKTAQGWVLSLPEQRGGL